MMTSKGFFHKGAPAFLGFTEGQAIHNQSTLNLSVVIPEQCACIIAAHCAINNNGNAVVSSCVLDPSGLNLPLTKVPSSTDPNGNDIWYRFNPPAGTFTLRSTVANGIDRTFTQTSLFLKGVTALNAHNASEDSSSPDSHSLVITPTQRSIIIISGYGALGGQGTITATFPLPNSIKVDEQSNEANNFRRSQALAYSTELHIGATTVQQDISNTGSSPSLNKIVAAAFS